MSQKQYKPHYQHLLDKWTRKHHELKKELWNKHKTSLNWLQNTSKQAVVGSMAGVIMMAHPASTTVLAQALPTPQPVPAPVEKKVDKKAKLKADLKGALPETVQPLTDEQETTISTILSENFNMPVSASLNGMRLNRSYGLIGAEQHLMRYPGDTMESHFQTQEEATKYYSSGMAPGRGAWGYFVQPGQTLSQTDIEREKYYIAVQTFLSPGWNERTHEMYAFFKYRKMLVVNAENGKGMVVVIGDAGPAEFTGKHLGGSPEVMKYLERVDGGAKGPVLYFFIDDPENKIPLGPVEL